MTDPQAVFTTPWDSDGLLDFTHASSVVPSSSLDDLMATYCSGQRPRRLGSFNDSRLNSPPIQFTGGLSLLRAPRKRSRTDAASLPITRRRR